MPDKYDSFSQLSKHEPKGSFNIESRQLKSPIALIAPHAGKIEPGTSEICKAVAGHDLTYYLFEGCKEKNNSDLHITSVNFDEPCGLEIAKLSQVVVTFHGQASKEYFVNIGGLHTGLGDSVMFELTRIGYSATRRSNPELQGLNAQNICNKGSTGQGLQLEISRGLRNHLTTDEADLILFAETIRTAFKHHDGF